MTFEELKAPDGGIRLKYHPESKSIQMQHAPPELDRVAMYGLLLMAQQKKPDKTGSFLPAFNPLIEIGISIVRVDGVVKYACSPEIGEVELLGLLGLASELVLGKRPNLRTQRPPQQQRIIRVQ